MSTKKTIRRRPQSGAQAGMLAQGTLSSKEPIPTKFMTILLLTGCILAGLAATGTVAPAEAASFDCTKATQPLDKRICGDAELSKLDEDLAAAYGKAKAGLSPAGQKVLQTGQHDWLGYSRRICKTRLDPKIAKLVGESVEDCLKGEYRDRTEDLQQYAVYQSSGFTFGRGETYVLSASDPSVASSHTGFTYTRVSWPLIDVAPAGIDGTAWNKTMTAVVHKLATPDTTGADVDEAPDAGDGQAGGDQAGSDQPEQDADDLDIDYNFDLITPQMISIEVIYSVIGHGAAHPTGGSEIHSILLADGRELTAKDLFRSDRDWQGYMIKRSHAAWRDIMADMPDAVDDKAIAEMVKLPTNWQLTDKGISLLFPTYSVGPYVVGDQQVDFTWDELKPYLLDKLPFTRP